MPWAQQAPLLRRTHQGPRLPSRLHPSRPLRRQGRLRIQPQLWALLSEQVPWHGPQVQRWRSEVRPLALWVPQPRPEPEQKARAAVQEVPRPPRKVTRAARYCHAPRALRHGGQSRARRFGPAFRHLEPAVPHRSTGLLTPDRGNIPQSLSWCRKNRRILRVCMKMSRRRPSESCWCSPLVTRFLFVRPAWVYHVIGVET